MEYRPGGKIERLATIKTLVTKYYLRGIRSAEISQINYRNGAISHFQSATGNAPHNGEAFSVASCVTLDGLASPYCFRQLREHCYAVLWTNRRQQYHKLGFAHNFHFLRLLAFHVIPLS